MWLPFRNSVKRQLKGVNFPETEAAGLLNELASVRNLFDSYLEIGIEYGLTLSAVRSKKKTGVDPESKMSKSHYGKNIKIHSVPSDEFFSGLDKNIEYDLIYLDGLHQFEQTYRDLQNSFQHAAPKALILVDDTVPIDEFSANPDGLEAYRLREAAGHINTGAWHGDVYKVILALDEVARDKVEWATVVDLSNPKTLIYLKPGQSWPELPAINSGIYAHENFHTNFSQSINPRFKPKTREQLLLELRK